MLRQAMQRKKREIKSEKKPKNKVEVVKLLRLRARVILRMTNLGMGQTANVPSTIVDAMTKDLSKKSQNLLASPKAKAGIATVLTEEEQKMIVKGLQTAEERGAALFCEELRHIMV